MRTSGICYFDECQGPNLQLLPNERRSISLVKYLFTLVRNANAFIIAQRSVKNVIGVSTSMSAKFIR